MKYWIEVMMEKNIFITFEGNINIKDLNWLPPIFDSDTKWIDISRITTFEQVNQLLHHMILYNDVYFKYNNSQHDTMLRMIDIMNHHEMILPGGLHFIGEAGENIFPSCCCGFEDWKSIVSELLNGNSPWMGHDPYVNCRFENESCIVTTESVENRFETENVTIKFEKNEFHNLLLKLVNEFNDFVNVPLKQFLISFTPDYAGSFCAAFKKCFS